MLSDYKREQREQLIAGLRDVLEYLESHPDIAPSMATTCLNLWASSKEEFLTLRRKTGASEKVTWGLNDERLALRKHFRGGFYLDVNVDKEQTCQKVQVGTKVSPAHDEIKIPAKPETIEPVYDWICPDSFLADTNGQPEPAAQESEVAV
jgi:hypothetical protein